MSTVTVTMAFHGGALRDEEGRSMVHASIRRAVESLLAQTYRDWRVVIVNDADPAPPWPAIADIDDPRVVRHDLRLNRGRYFIDAVIFDALRPEYWALQDPDDHCEPDRFERMVPLAEEHGAAFAPTLLYNRGEGRPPLFDAKGMRDEPRPDRIHHMVGYGSGVISGARLRAIGGFHPGYRVAFDTYMMNAVKLAGPWVALDAPALQHKLKRPGSLTTTPATAMRSQHRMAARARLDAMWRDAWARHQRGEPIAPALRSTVPPALAAEVRREAARLRAVASSATGAAA